MSYPKYLLQIFMKYPKYLLPKFMMYPKSLLEKYLGKFGADSSNCLTRDVCEENTCKAHEYGDAVGTMVKISAI